jgi:hypothetical protein
MLFHTDSQTALNGEVLTHCLGISISNILVKVHAVKSLRGGDRFSQSIGDTLQTSPNGLTWYIM